MGAGNGFRFAGRQGVVAAHDALQGGHFDDHAGRQVGFAQFGCAQSRFFIFSLKVQARQIKSLTSFSTRRVLSRMEPSFFLEGKGVEAREKVAEFFVCVVFVKESGVGISGADDVFIAFDDEVGVVG